MEWILTENRWSKVPNLYNVCRPWVLKTILCLRRLCPVPLCDHLQEMATVTMESRPNHPHHSRHLWIQKELVVLPTMVAAQVSFDVIHRTSLLLPRSLKKRWKLWMMSRCHRPPPWPKFKISSHPSCHLRCQRALDPVMECKFLRFFALLAENRVWFFLMSEQIKKLHP